MTTPHKNQALFTPYKKTSLKPNLRLQKLELIALQKEKIVKNPNISLSQKEYEQAEQNIILAREAVLHQLSIIHEHNEIEDKLNLRLPFI
jgi:hypothetical protein